MKEEIEHFLLMTLQSFLKNSSDMIFIKDTSLTYVTASEAFIKMAGLEKQEDVAGKTDYDFFDPVLAEKYTSDDQEVLRTGKSVEDYIEPLPERFGQKKYSSTSKYVIRDEQGEIIGTYGIARDVTVRMQLEAEREMGRLSRQMFDSVLEADLMDNTILRLEGFGWMQELNNLEEPTYDSLVSTVSCQFIHPDHSAAFQAFHDRDMLVREFETNDSREMNILTYMQDCNGCYRWVECTARIYHSRISDTVRMTAFLKDVDDEVRSKQRLQKKADTDALTKLSNRESVMRQINEQLAREDGEEQCALLFIDLDCFKQVNDNWGHRFGDSVLQKTAEKLLQMFDQNAVCGRIGGDEFLVFLEHAESKEELEKLAHRTVELLSYHYEENDMQVHITCSIGVAFCHRCCTTLEQLYEQADKAMYRAKEEGKNRVFFYEDNWIEG